MGKETETELQLASLPEGGLRLQFKGHTVVEHGESTPFATAIRMQKTYRARFGSVKIREKVERQVPLTRVEILEQGPDRAVLTVSADGVTLTLTAMVEQGALRVTLSATEGYAYRFRFPSTPEEAIFGGGEQYRKLNLKGERVVNFVSEHIKYRFVVEKAILPRCLYREKPLRHIGTYAPMPTYVSSRLYAIRFDVSCDGKAVFQKPMESTYVFNQCPRSFLYVAEDSFREINRRLNADLPVREQLPDWCYDGFILGVQSGIETVTEKAFRMLDQGAKVCGVWCQDWSGEKITKVGKQVYWNWSADNRLYPNLAEGITRLKERGVHFLGYINPYLLKDAEIYNYCKEKGWLITHSDGSVYHIMTTTFQAGMMDLTNPDMVDYLKHTLIQKNMLDLGMDGYMADFGEYLPVDCVLHDGNPALLHNEWPVLWAKINREAVEEYGNPDVMFFTRSAYSGAQSHTYIMWNGDQHTDFTKDYGLPCVMPATFNLGFSGLPVVHSDVGGFFTLGRLHRDAEVFVRWEEMCAFSPMMRSHETIRPWINAQYDSPGVAPYTVKLSRIHAKLKPYLQHCMEEAREGIPVMRPDFYHCNDYSRHSEDYAYFLGEDLFVAPVIQRGATARQLTLPEGNWIHLFSGQPYTGGPCTVAAPLGEPAVFYREDSSFAPVFEALIKE